MSTSLPSSGNEPIQRDGRWWFHQPDGTWLRWEDESAAWEPQPSGPPAPTAPDPAEGAPEEGAPEEVAPEEVAPEEVAPEEVAPEETAPVSVQEVAAESPPQPYTDYPGSLIGSGAYTTDPLAPYYEPVPSTSAFGSYLSSGRFGLSERAIPIVIGLAALLVVVAAIFVGKALFGGGEEPNGRASARAALAGRKEDPKAAYIRKVDALCGIAMERNKAVVAVPASSPREAARLTREVVKLNEKALQSMRRLRPPPQDRQKIKVLFGLYDRAIVQIRKMAAAARERDMYSYRRAVRRLVPLNKRFNRLATDYGFRVCNQDS